MAKLKCLVDAHLYLDPKDIADNPRIVSHDEARIIFRNIKILFKASVRFLSELKKASSSEKVGPVLSWYFGSAGFSKNYVEYSRLHNLAISVLQDVVCRKEAATEFRKIRMAFNSQDIRRSIEVMDEPIKRVVEYKKIVGKFATDHPSDANVAKGLESLKTVLRKMNEASLENDEYVLEQAIKHLSEHGVEVKAPVEKRSLVAQKAIEILCQGEVQDKKRECFLFSDALVIADPPNSITIDKDTNYVCLHDAFDELWQVEINYGSSSVKLFFVNQSDSLLWYKTIEGFGKENEDVYALDTVMKEQEQAAPVPEEVPEEPIKPEPVVEPQTIVEEIPQAIRFRIEAVKAMAEKQEWFIEEITRIEETFIIPLKENKALDDVQRAVLFSNFSEIRNLYKTFTAELTKMTKSAEATKSDITLGYFLLYFLPQLSDLCIKHANLYGAMETITEDIKSHSETMQHFKSEEELMNVINYQFEHLKRLQRLIREVIENTPEDHADHASLNMSCDMIDAVDTDIQMRIKSSREAVAAAKTNVAEEDEEEEVQSDEKRWIVSFLENSVPENQVNTICKGENIVLPKREKPKIAAPKLLAVEKMVLKRFAANSSTFMDGKKCQKCNEKKSFIRWKITCSVCSEAVCSSCSGLYNLQTASEKGCSHVNTRAEKEVVKQISAIKV